MRATSVAEKIRLQAINPKDRWVKFQQKHTGDRSGILTSSHKGNARKCRTQDDTAVSAFILNGGVRFLRKTSSRSVYPKVDKCTRGPSSHEVIGASHASIPRSGARSRGIVDNPIIDLSSGGVHRLYHMIPAMMGLLRPNSRSVNTY